jgi:hypothetical protein
VLQQGDNVGLRQVVANAWDEGAADTGARGEGLGKARITPAVLCSRVQLGVDRSREGAGLGEL